MAYMVYMICTVYMVYMLDMVYMAQTMGSLVAAAYIKPRTQAAGSKRDAISHSGSSDGRGSSRCVS
eukprot:CAMPEP_0119306392 /NCGR_PEP_ID=MMETSP1333-20130426/7169_1 /TAXON_ID=418940 /ORGANISM="Scyphosphaera apsteinii, Strain RCC1455" /LENGTH=65 /DNA_ID=CAMNT_0007309689 /DNA_START=144 /DNA_END=341 /DNA_ORIENTATION=+